VLESRRATVGFAVYGEEAQGFKKTQHTSTSAAFHGWDKVIVGRKSDLKNWVDVLKQLVSSKKIRKLFGFMNNHYAGHGPAMVELFTDLWNKLTIKEEQVLESSSSTRSWGVSEAIPVVRILTDVACGNQGFPVIWHGEFPVV